MSEHKMSQHSGGLSLKLREHYALQRAIFNIPPYYWRWRAQRLLLYNLPPLLWTRSWRLL